MAQQRLPWERDDEGVVVLTLEAGERPLVVLDRAMLESIDAALDEIGPDPSGFVLTSSGRVFVAGADLREVMSLSDEALDEYLRFGQRVFGRISALKCGSVAAVTGAALGGGLEIAMHCDRLVALEPTPREPGGEAKPYAVGLPEAGLEICPGWGGANMLPARIDPEEAVRMTATGRPSDVVTMAGRGLFDRTYPSVDELIAGARLLALEIGGSGRDEPRNVSDDDVRASVTSSVESLRGELGGGAAEAVLSCVESGLRGGWRAGLDAERVNLVRLRGTEEAKAAIGAFFERSAARS